MLDKKYGVIYADPPWPYDIVRWKSRDIKNHYSTMTIEDICNLKVPSADDSILYLWATAPKLPEAFKVMEAWEFKYRTCAVWNKETMGLGTWFRIQHELLLVGVKGNPSAPNRSLRKRSIFNIKRLKHSQKPQEFRDLINYWYPNEEKIELFAREHDVGWSVFGNEAPSQERAVVL
jgi:N6-adenosine-specific RNA methylase IME4